MSFKLTDSKSESVVQSINAVGESLVIIDRYVSLAKEALGEYDFGDAKRGIGFASVKVKELESLLDKAMVGVLSLERCSALGFGSQKELKKSFSGESGLVDGVLRGDRKFVDIVKETFPSKARNE